VARFVLALTLLFIVWSAPRLAVAHERAFALVWSAPTECPDAATIEQYVDDVLGDGNFGPLAVRASGTVSRTTEGRYAVTLELDAGAAQPSRRALDAEDCEAVSRASALLIALAIRARAAPIVPPPPPPVAPPAPPPPQRARGFVSVLGEADVGAVPTPTLGLGLAVGARWPRLLLESSFAYFAPRSTTAKGSADVGARFQMMTLGARACAPITVTALWLAPCLGAGVDRVGAPGFGARVTRRPTAWDAVGRFGLLAGWDISSIISARAEIEGVLPLARPEFEVDGVGDVFRRAPVGGRAGLGLQLQF
jgi:hypothetical protein